MCYNMRQWGVTMANVFYYDIDKIKSYYIDPKKDFFVVQKNLIYVIFYGVF